MTIEVTGLAELEKELKGLSDSMASKVLIQSTGLAANEIVKEAKSRVSRRTGKAQKAIGKQRKVTDKAAIVYVGVKQQAWYAVTYLERGTVKMGAKPWLVPALEAVQEKTINRLAKELRRKIDKAIR